MITPLSCNIYIMYKPLFIVLFQEYTTQGRGQSSFDKSLALLGVHQSCKLPTTKIKGGPGIDQINQGVLTYVSSLAAFANGIRGQDEIRASKIMG